MTKPTDPAMTTPTRTLRDKLTDLRHDIMRDVCELSPAEPEADETICVTYEQMASVIQGHLDALLAAEGRHEEKDQGAALIHQTIPDVAETEPRLTDWPFYRKNGWPVDDQ